MKLTKKTLFLVLLGLFIGSVAVDVDHGYVYSRNILENARCMAYGFFDIESQGLIKCTKQMIHRPFLHDWRVGLFLLAFVTSYNIVLKNEKKGDQ